MCCVRSHRPWEKTWPFSKNTKIMLIFWLTPIWRKMLLRVDFVFPALEKFYYKSILVKTIIRNAIKKSERTIWRKNLLSQTTVIYHNVDRNSLVSLCLTYGFSPFPEIFLNDFYFGFIFKVNQSKTHNRNSFLMVNFED